MHIIWMSDYINHSTSSSKLGSYDAYKLSCHPERPRYLDYLHLFSSVEPCCSSNRLGNELIQTHRAALIIDGIRVDVMLIGQQVGPSSNLQELKTMMRSKEELTRWNNGMPTAASFERAMEAVSIAVAENRPIITFVDTPGADPTERAEREGIAWRIGSTIGHLLDAPVATVAVILNRACSGGAVALTACDHILALENSTFSPIAPEACSSILFRNRDRADEAAELLQLTAADGLRNGVIDEIVSEGPEPAHIDPKPIFDNLSRALKRSIQTLTDRPSQDLIKDRDERWHKMGRWGTASSEHVASLEPTDSFLPEPTDLGYIMRHKDCRDSSGRRLYQPVVRSKLIANRLLCEDCGKRYAYRSLPENMAAVLDPDSFLEHDETKLIIDQDLLGFPEYADQLVQAQVSTGLAAATLTGNATINGLPVVFCGNAFQFVGGSLSMCTAEKLWRAGDIAMRTRTPLVVVACGGGARMQEGAFNYPNVIKAQLAVARVERAGVPVVTILTDPTLGGITISFACRGTKLFEDGAANIGFSGRRVIEQFTKDKLSTEFQTTRWLLEHGHAEHVIPLEQMKAAIHRVLLDQRGLWGQALHFT